MNLAVRERAYYQASPLVEVICQLRFPRQLELQEMPPVEFQRELKSHYPLIETRDSISVPLTALLENGNVARSPLREVAYDFLDEDRTHKVTVTSEFLAVSTAAYSRWEEFEVHVARATRTLLACYGISVFTRIGLRYQNLIRPSEHGLKRAKPSALFVRELLGPMTALGSAVQAHESTTTIRLDGGGLANLRFAASADESNASYVLDCDVFTEENIKADFDVALGKLNNFHSEASHIFRWCIKERLHSSFGPEPC